MSAIHDVAWACLNARDPSEKIALTAQAARDWRAGLLTLDGAATVIEPLPMPGRPERPRLVSPRELPQRGLGSAEGRAALIHAVAHIEFNAINLAWDAVYRFRAMPREFVDDWIAVAADEARHFELLRERLAHYGHAYGDFDAHNGLWEMAVATQEDALARMALVPRVLEARGLDVTPGMIERLRANGDHDTVAVLEVILREEVAHVAAGTRWFQFLCVSRGVESVATFLDLIQGRARGAVRLPFNEQARMLAGFRADELAALAELARPGRN